jgi:hypothetical protein
MYWLRAQGTKVAWVALFALACQAILSFGHVHFGKLSSSSTVIAFLASAAQGEAAEQPAAPPAPTKGLADEFCAICSHMNVASTLIAPTTPTVLPPISVVKKLRWSISALDPTWFDLSLFDARGPPKA